MLSAHAPRRRLLAVELLDDPPLGVGGHAFVEPEVVPRRVGREIARPAVRQLMRDQADQALVAGDEGRREEGQCRVFHAAEREGRRQDEHVVAAPAIWSVKLLGGGDHFLGIGQLARGGIDRCRLGPDAGARARAA